MKPPMPVLIVSKEEERDLEQEAWDYQRSLRLDTDAYDAAQAETADKVSKRLSRAFGNKKARNAQLVSRLKRKRGYAAPVRGGTGKQGRTRRKKFAKHLPGQHDQQRHGNRNTGTAAPLEDMSQWGENDWWRDGPGERGDFMDDGNPRRFGTRANGPHKLHYPGQCYEKAGLSILNHEAGEGAVLVHGVIRGGFRGDVAHAWVRLPDGYIFEPTTDSVYHPDDFLEFFNPLTVIEYRDTSDVLQLMQKTEHFGPWDQASDMWYRAFEERGAADQYTGTTAATDIIVERGYYGDFDDVDSPGAFLGDHADWQDEIDALIVDATDDYDDDDGSFDGYNPNPTDADYENEDYE